MELFTFRAIGVTVSMLLLSGCATLKTPSEQLEDALFTGLSGTWDNRAQYATTAESLKVAPSVNGDWLDLQHAIFKRIDAPAIGDKVLYLEWRGKKVDGTLGATLGSNLGAISRQRIWSFRTDANNTVRMDFYAFIDGKLFAEPNANFAALQKTALRGYGPECALYFTQNQNSFTGEITAKDCSITAASGRRMGINARVVLNANGSLEYQESGVLDDGKFAFRVPPTQPYKFIQIAK